MGDALFIDEYRLLATTPDNEDPALILWDFSVEVKPGMKPTSFILELENPISGEQWEDIGVFRDWRSEKTALPFRDDPSAGIVVLLLKEAKTAERTFVIPVKALVGLSTPENGLGDLRLRQKHSTVTVRWDDWKHFAVLVEPPAKLLGTDPAFWVFHSQVAYLEEAGPDVFLHVHDFSESLYSGMAEKAKGRQSSDAPSPPPYVPHKVKLPDRTFDHLGISPTPQGLAIVDGVRTPML